MGALSDFIHQQAPTYKKDMPAYYRNALRASGIVLMIYFLGHIVLFLWADGPWVFPAIMTLAMTAFCFMGNGRVHPGVALGLFAFIILFWCGSYIYGYGWGCGGQHLLIPLLMLVFFHIYIPPWRKILYLLALIAYRMLLYAWTLRFEPIWTLTSIQNIVYQSVNSVVLFLILALNCILLSSSLQDTERQLRIDNEELFREAGTDPLTGIPNRRAMLNTMHDWIQHHSNESYCVAIADIDFFKKVNDTYGHDCGDYTLQRLTTLLQEKARDKYQVCRWGGEEFCIFMPGMNLDEGGMEMNELCVAASQMKLEFKENRFRISITIGVEENDFHSPLDDLLKSADQKLYMGKNSGRNQVVV